MKRLNPELSYNKPKRQKLTYISVALLGLIVILLMPWFSTILTNYTSSNLFVVKDDGVYFKNKKLEGANPSEFIVFDPWIAGKDSSNVYCRGKIVEGVDVASFKKLGTGNKLYIDKNHIYALSPPFSLSSKKLRILENTGIDKNTIKAVGSEVYKDKDHLYVALINYPYIVQIETPPGLNLTEFKYLPQQYVYTDGNKYFRAIPGGLLLEEPFMKAGERKISE